jgi:hypothetical protein
MAFGVSGAFGVSAPVAPSYVPPAPQEEKAVIGPIYMRPMSAPSVRPPSSGVTSGYASTRPPSSGFVAPTLPSLQSLTLPGAFSAGPLATLAPGLLPSRVTSWLSSSGTAASSASSAAPSSAAEQMESSASEGAVALDPVTGAPVGGGNQRMLIVLAALALAAGAAYAYSRKRRK